MRALVKKHLLALATLTFCLALATHDAWAKGKGGMGNGGRAGGKAHVDQQASKRGGAAKHASNRVDRGPSGHGLQSGDKHAAKDRSTWPSRGHDRVPANNWDKRGAHPWSMQRANEERKLEDRLSTADKLDELAQRNGNANLHDTAARKRDKARELYEKRLAKIDSKDPSSFPTDEVGRFGGGLDSWDSDDLVGRNDLFGDNPFARQNLAGRENALFRQLQNEQRQLASRMDVADRLWDAFDQTGDTWLADAAQAFEDRALAQFEKRMDAISAFQQRHGLSDVSLQEPAPARPAITR